MDYWFIKAVLILALLVVGYFMVRPTRSDSSLALRRIGLLLVLMAAVFAIIFPEVFNNLARAIGVASGTNLLVYLIVIVILAQMASSYRKDLAAKRKLTALARKLALMEAQLTATGVIEVEVGEAEAPSQAGPKTPDDDGRGA